jgi:hypothetical protein
MIIIVFTSTCLETGEGNSHLNILFQDPFNITLSSITGLSNVFFLSDFPAGVLYAFINPSHACYMLCPPYHPLFYHSNNILRAKLCLHGVHPVVYHNDKKGYIQPSQQQCCIIYSYNYSTTCFGPSRTIIR